MLVKQKILVTGAAGFIGHALCKQLLREGQQVVGLDNINDYYDVQLKYDRLADLKIDRGEAVQWNRTTKNKSGTFSFLRINLEDQESLVQLFKEYGFDAVVNLAAQAGVRYSLENPMAYVDSNLVGFVNLLECCRHHSIKHLVFASSSSVYGENKKVPFAEDDRVDHPVSLYAATKKSNELIAHAYSHLYKLPVSGLRFFTVYGPWGRPDMAPMLFADAISRDQPIQVFNNGKMSRDFTYIEDIVNGILITLNHPPNKGVSRSWEKETDDGSNQNYQLFNIGKGAPIQLMDFIETLERELDKKAIKEMQPMQPGDVSQTYADTAKLNALGYESKIEIDEGVAKFVTWFKKYYGKA